MANVTSKKPWGAISVTLLLIAYQLIRIVSFVNVYGGIEHDSGWFLTVARSLAERGTYTTMVSTIVDPQAVGDINIDQKFDIQDERGRILFFTGNGNGPAAIVPNAIPLKLFGSNFWSLRAGPLIFYTLFLVLAAYILYQLAGLWAIILFHAFLFFYPHISIFLSYEAMGEVASMVYILWAYLAFAAATKRGQQRRLYFLLAGLVLGLTLSAKLITLWAVSGILVWATILWFINGLSGLTRKQERGQDRRWLAFSQWRLAKIGFSELLLLGLGVFLTLALWELIHLVILTRLVGFELYREHAYQRLKFVLDDGSGVGLQLHSGLEFFGDKFFLLQEIAHPQRWVTALIFMGIIIGGIYLLFAWRKQPPKQNLWVPMWLGWFAHTAWFVGLAKTGWARHLWFALVLAMMLLSVISVNLVRIGLDRNREKKSNPSPRKRHKLILASGVLLLTLMTWGFVSQTHIWGFYLPHDIVPYWRDKQINNKYDASLPWVIIPRADQAEVVEYIQQLPLEAKIYYPGQHKSAEIPPQSGRLHYPLNRRKRLEPHAADIVLVGPSLISPWKNPLQLKALVAEVERQCPHPVIRNDFYMICPIEANLMAQ